MEFYRAEFLIDNLKNFSEKEGEQRKKEEADYAKNTPSMASTSNMMKEAQAALPKFNMPSFKVPTF